MSALASSRSTDRDIARVGLPDRLQALKALLGPKLLAVTLDADKRSIDRWISDKSRPTDLRVERRVDCAYQVFELLKPLDASQTIRAWFMGMNPQMDDLSPAEAIADDQFREVLAAARAFAAGG